MRARVHFSRPFALQHAVKLTSTAHPRKGPLKAGRGRGGGRRLTQLAGQTSGMLGPMCGTPPGGRAARGASRR
eukprot:4071080-Alexandrium_andersonii.AAC.1